MSSSTPRKDIFDWLAHHPREGLQLAVLALVAYWQVLVAVFGFALFFLLSRVFKFVWWQVLALGATTALATWLIIEISHDFRLPITQFLPEGITANRYFLTLLFTHGFRDGLAYAYQATFPYLLGFSPLVAGCLAGLDCIPNHPYEKTFLHFKKGKPSSSRKAPPHLLDQALSHLSSTHPDGTVLGISMKNRQPVIVSDDVTNQLVLVLGTTGGGKTITLRRFYERALSQGYPLIVVDGKPSDENVKWVMSQARHFSRPFYGFNCGDCDHYDPLAYGGYTELKDKIISLKDEWESEYYRSIAEDYLQTTFEVLLKLSETFDLSTVAQCLDYHELASRVRVSKDQDLMNRVRCLERYDSKDMTGLQAHLNLLIHSELGDYFKKTEQAFSLAGVLQSSACAYFALPALRFPSFSKVLGKLIINDLKAVIDRISHPRIFTIFDEFSVFAGEQVLNLVNMGRGKGLHSIFGTQGLADLERVDPIFSKQMLNCVNTLICHRLNDQDSAESISHWVGTREVFDLTLQVSDEKNRNTLGSVRQNKAFILHPDEIKQHLQPGEAFYITKVNKFQQDKIKIKYS